MSNESATRIVMPLICASGARQGTYSHMLGVDLGFPTGVAYATATPFWHLSRRDSSHPRFLGGPDEYPHDSRALGHKLAIFDL